MRGIYLVTMMLGATATALAADPPAPATGPAFVVGEQLRYRIFWGPVPVGEAVLEVRREEPLDGHRCFYLVGTARTVGLGRLLYPVDSMTESWLDAESWCTRRFRQDRHEGTHHRRDVTDYDYTANLAVTRNLDNDKTKQVALDGPVLDMLSCLYYVRQQPLALDREEKFVLHAGNELFRVSVRPDQRRSLSVRPVGDGPALRLEPQPTLKIVAANKGRMWFWVTDDVRHLPLTLTSTMSIGSLKLVLYAVGRAAPGGGDQKSAVSGQ